jgi:uncharacterized protein (TIGR03086 family)
MSMVEAILDPIGARVVERACSSTQAVLARVSEMDLDRPTPCASWTVTGVIRHVVGGAAYFAELAEAGEVADDDDDDDDKPIADFNGSFARSAERLVAAFDAPGALDKILKMPIGDIPASVGVWIASGDIFTHGWDLAKATGQSTDLDPELAETLLQRLNTMLPDSMRGPDGKAPFGLKVDVPSSAPAADRLAGYLGRTP